MKKKSAVRALLKSVFLFISARRPALYAALLVAFLMTILGILASRLPGSAGDPQQTSTAPTTSENLLTGVPAAALARLDVLKVGIDDDLTTINPLFSTGDGEIAAVNLIFEPLVRIDENGQPVAVLASEWLFDMAAHSLVFTLRQDHTFQDGRVIGVSDVLFTYQCLMDSSYDGPLRGRLDEIVSVSAGQTADTIQFILADWVQDPDFAEYTTGILKADYYECPAGQVFEMRNQNLAPQGSGPFFLTSQGEQSLMLQRRPGYGGSINRIELLQVASKDKYQMLLDGDIDIAHNLWDTRMQAREANLPGYTFSVFETSAESYFMVNPEPLPSNMIQLPSQRLAVLLSVAGKPLSGLQLESLQELAQKKLVIYYFAGLEDAVQQSNEDRAREIAIRLQFTGLSVDIQGAGWPDLVQRATSGDFDLLLLPATANSRLPDSAVLLDNLARPESSAWVAAYRSEVFIASNRLAQLSINPRGNPFAALAASWTDRIENVRIYNADGSFWEE